jgi:hypothetical protein
MEQKFIHILFISLQLYTKFKVQIYYNNKKDKISDNMKLQNQLKCFFLLQLNVTNLSFKFCT